MSIVVRSARGRQIMTRKELLREVELLYQEVLASRRAAEITADLMAAQFAKIEQVNQSLEDANQALQRVSSFDGLTEVPNRRYYDEMLEKEWRRCRRHHSPISLILIDIDYFKYFNDRYGHIAGDQCLKQVAKALQSMVGRASDTVARYGGEEFVYLLPDCDTAAAVHVSEKSRKTIELLNVPHADSPVASVVTISLGIASVVPVQHGSPTELMQAADQALYQAKDQGRNRYVIHANWRC